MPTTPKLALITGASGGIGLATCLALAKEGYSIALHYNSASPSHISTSLSSIRSIHSSLPSSSIPASSSLQAESFRADLSSYDAIRQLHAEVVEKMGEVDILFLNAGTTGGVSGVSNIKDISIEVFEETWRINTAGPFLLAQLCLPKMEERGWGRVIFCSSVAGITGGVVGGHYASSKSGLHGLVHWLAGTVAKKGITVNAVAPALIEETNMLPSGGEELMAKIPVGRFGKPDEVASTVVWMVKNSYVTNKVVAVDGGFSY